MSAWVCRTFGGHADPVEVSREFLGYVRLPPGRKSHHHDDCGGVGKVGGPTCCQEGYMLKQQLLFRGFINKRMNILNWYPVLHKKNSEQN